MGRGDSPKKLVTLTKILRFWHSLDDHPCFQAPAAALQLSISPRFSPLDHSGSQSPSGSPSSTWLKCRIRLHTLSLLATSEPPNDEGHCCAKRACGCSRVHFCCWFIHQIGEACRMPSAELFLVTELRLNLRAKRVCAVGCVSVVGSTIKSEKPVGCLLRSSRAVLTLPLHLNN